MANLNKVFLMGRLTRDPELRYTPGGAAVTDLSVAINRSFSTRDGDTREETVFVDVTVWDRQAETCCQYLKKGRSIHVEGSLKMDSWEDKATGEKRSKLKIQADRVQFLDRRDDAPGGGGGYDEAPAPVREAPARRESSGGVRSAPANGGGRNFGPPGGSAPRRPAPEPETADSDDEDIPF
ncbi:MAG: single-stranded DNA-binding protein [Isosphaeraceae bacterium]